MENFLLLLSFLFGEESILFSQFTSITTYIKSYEHEYEERVQNHQWFLAKFISYVDRRILLFLESCSTATSVPNIKFHLINFDTLLQSIIDGTFSMDLPSVILNALEPPTKPEPTNTGKKRTPKKPDDNGSNKWTPPQHGEPAINASIHPPWPLKDGENYVENFIRRIDRSRLPTRDICLNYHIRGTCHSLCTQASTHIPVSSLSDQQCTSTTEFIRATRAQYAQQHNRPRPNWLLGGTVDSLANSENPPINLPVTTHLIPRWWHKYPPRQPCSPRPII